MVILFEGNKHAHDDHVVGKGEIRHDLFRAGNLGAWLDLATQDHEHVYVGVIGNSIAASMGAKKHDMGKAVAVNGVQTPTEFRKNRLKTRTHLLTLPQPSRTGPSLIKY